MRVLITGSSGFIGSHLVEKLRRVQCNVFEFDLPNYDVRRSDIVRETFDKFKPEIVFHLGGVLGTSELFDISQKIVIETNILGTVNVIKSCIKHGSKLVYSSMPRVWLNPYSISKSAAQDYIKSYGEYYGLNYTNLIISNAYGPRQKTEPYKKVIPTFITKALRNEPIPINGSGEQEIDLIYIDDVVNALVLSGPPHCGYQKTLDIGFGCSYKVSEVAKCIIDMTGSKSDLIYKDSRKGEDFILQRIDVKPARMELGFNALVHLQQGLEKTIEYYRNNLQ